MLKGGRALALEAKVRWDGYLWKRTCVPCWDWRKARSLRRKLHNNKSCDQGRGLPVSWPLPGQSWPAQPE